MRIAATATTRMPSAGRLASMQGVIIPHTLMTIRQAAQALELERRHSMMAFMTLTVDNDDMPPLRKLLGAYTQPVIALGVLRCRYLLEFLGIKTIGAPPALKAIDRRRASDIGIEHFTSADGARLSRVTPEEAARVFLARTTTPRAWATVIEIANQRLAHPTDDHKLSGTGNVSAQLETTFATIPELLFVKYYDALGVDRPQF
jgi:hypothetical protein